MHNALGLSLIRALSFCNFSFFFLCSWLCAWVHPFSLQTGFIRPGSTRITCKCTCVCVNMKNDERGLIFIFRNLSLCSSVRNTASFYLFTIFNVQVEDMWMFFRLKKEYLMLSVLQRFIKISLRSMNPVTFESMCICQVVISADANLLFAAISTQAKRSSVWPSKCHRFRTAF